MFFISGHFEDEATTFYAQWKNFFILKPPGVASSFCPLTYGVLSHGVVFMLFSSLSIRTVLTEQ